MIGRGTGGSKYGKYISGHFLIDLLYSIIISVLIAIFLFAVGIARPFVSGLVVSLCYGVSIFITIHILFGLVNPKPGRGSHIAIVLAASIVGTLVTLAVAPYILERFFSIPALFHRQRDIFQSVILFFAIGGTVFYFFLSAGRLRASKEIIQQERINRLSSEKDALEAKLRLLQAQIEPHFLFNTLSNVLSLIDIDPMRGKAMLSDLILYLRTSLSRTLPTATTLDQEMDMCRAYLNIQKVRMGERLRFEIDLPEALRQQPFPPMLIQPLVENGLKHGLEPKVEGGAITVRAAEVDGSLRITIADTGDGFSEFEQGGVGIANVRERLSLLFGEKGRLLLEENVPHGVRAIIEVPKDGL
jgi:sensor histidine kinase YesM